MRSLSSPQKRLPHTLQQKMRTILIKRIPMKIKIIQRAMKKPILKKQTLLLKKRLFQKLRKRRRLNIF
jgi:hypothetical protein